MQVMDLFGLKVLQLHLECNLSYNLKNCIETLYNLSQLHNYKHNQLW